MNNYYTYAYLRKDRTPYYIGKGTKYRAFDRTRRGVKPPRDKSRIIFLKQNLTEEEAFRHEIYMIAIFGRKDLGTGILHNRTNGGEGVSGYRFSEDSKKAKSVKYTGKKRSPHTEETKEKLRKARLKQEDPRKGKKHSEETKELLRRQKSKYLYTLVSPQGEVFYANSSHCFCEEYPEFNLKSSKIRFAASKNKPYKNWKITKKLIENKLN